MSVALKTSVSEPLFKPAGHTFHLGAIHTQLELFALEQRSTARRIQELRDCVARCLPGYPAAAFPADDPRLCTLRVPSPTADHRGTAAVLRQKTQHILELLDENKGLHQQLARAEAESAAERARRRAHEAHAASTTAVLVQQNLQLTEARDALAAQLANTAADAQHVQDLQEAAVAAAARCGVLEAENAELRQAVDAFAEGSTSATVQQLQKIVAHLTAEVAQYSRREGDLRTKEDMLRDKEIRDKENHSIIRAMRKQTRELKRRSLQARNADLGVQESSNSIVTVKASTTVPSTLPAVPSFSEFFLI